MRTLKLTQKEVPSGSVIAVLSDIHIPHHDERAMQLVVECCEDVGVTHVFLNGDIADCGPASRHAMKKAKAALVEGSLRRSVDPGRWIYEWARSRPCVYLLGNHEAWVEAIVDSTPELHGLPTMDLLGLPDDGEGWTVLPSKSRVRLGSRCWEHGDGLFPSGAGGMNPGNRMKMLAPDQITSIGHLHRKFAAFWSNEDEDGISRTRGAYGNGHLSEPSAHEDYAGTYLNWQQSFEITRVWYDGGRPRTTTDQPEIHRDKRGMPVFEYSGRVYGSAAVRGA